MENNEQLKFSNENINYKLNQFLGILMCIWIGIPYIRVRVGVLFFVTVFVMWLITTDLKWFKYWTLDLIFILILLITFIPYIITGNFYYRGLNSITLLTRFILFFIGIFINYYYMIFKKDYKSLGKIAFFSIISFFIGSLQTYLGLLKYPNASRELAGAAYNNQFIVEIYNNLGIGGFGYIYATTFLMISLVYMVIRKNTLKKIKYRFLILIGIIPMFLMIFKASYAISLIILVLGIIFVICFKNKKTMTLSFSIGMVLLLFFQNTIGNLFLRIADIFFHKSILNIRFNEIAEVFLNNSVDGDLGNRFYRYFLSFKVFLKYPLFGIIGPFGNNKIAIGDHSGWFDFLASYGLFSSIPLFIVIFINFKKIISFFKKSNYFMMMLLIQILFIIYGFINPILTVFEIGFVIFYILPSIPFLPYAFSKDKVS